MILMTISSSIFWSYQYHRHNIILIILNINFMFPFSSMMQSVAIVQKKLFSQSIKSLLVAYYESKRIIPSLISQANQTQLTLDQSFISLKLTDDDSNINEGQITVDNLLEYPEGSEKKQLGMVIKGGPGSGKSTLLDKIAYTWAKKVKQKGKKVDFDFVFRIDLKKINTAKVKKEEYSFEKLIFFCLIEAFQSKQQNLDFKKKEDRQRRLLDQLSAILSRRLNKFLFLLDGYDEVKHFQGDLSENHSKNLFTIFQYVKNHSTIITSRPQAAQGSKSLEDFKRIIEIQPLQETSINKFIDQMLQGFKYRKKRDELKKQVKTNKNVMKIMQSPLNLTMVCLIYMNQEQHTNGINFATMNEIFLYDKIIKMITLRQEDKKFMNDLNRQDLQKAVSQGTLYEEIEPLNLLKETVYNIFRKGILTVKKQDIGESSDKKYDEKRKAIVRTIDFGLLRKKNGNKQTENNPSETKTIDKKNSQQKIDTKNSEPKIDKKNNDPKKNLQNEQYTFIHLSFAEYLFAYSIFQKLKNYVPINLKKINKQTTMEQIQEITSFIASNRYKSSYFNSFRHLTMLCSKYYNQQKIKYETRILPKDKKLPPIKKTLEKNKIDQFRYFKFPLETIWICFVCNIDGVIQFGKQQKLKLTIDMLGLSNYLPTKQKIGIQILNIVKQQFIEPYFSLKDESRKDQNKKSIARWYKYFVNSSYFPSLLTLEMVQQISTYFYVDKKGNEKMKRIAKLDDDFIVAFCQIVSCVISSKNNHFFNDNQQNKIKCMRYFFQILEKAPVQCSRIRYAVLSNLEDIFQSLEEKNAFQILLQDNNEKGDLISILLKQLGHRQSNQITFKLLCFFAKRQSQIKQKYILQEQLKSGSNVKTISNTLKNSSIRRRIFLSLKNCLKQVLNPSLQENNFETDIDESTIFIQVNSQKLTPSEPRQAEKCKKIHGQIKQQYWIDLRKKLDNNYFITQDENLINTLNTMIKQKLYNIFKYSTDEQLDNKQTRDNILQLDQINTDFQIRIAQSEVKVEFINDLDGMFKQIFQNKSKQVKYFQALKQFYLKKKIVNGYGHLIKDNAIVDLIKKIIEKLTNLQPSQKYNQLQFLEVIFERFTKLLRFLDKQSIISAVNIVVNHYMNKLLYKKLLQNDFQKGMIQIFYFLNESFSYIGKAQKLSKLQKIILQLQIIASKIPKGESSEKNKTSQKDQNTNNLNLHQTLHSRKNIQLETNQKNKTDKQQQNKQTQAKFSKIKSTAIIKSINFLELTMHYNTDQTMVYIIDTIIIPLCRFFHPQQNDRFVYNNSIKLAAIKFVKTPFTIMKSQRLLRLLKQLSILVKTKEKIAEEIINGIATQNKYKINDDQLYLIIEIIGVGVSILSQEQRTQLIRSQLHFFQSISERKSYRRGIILMNQILYSLGLMFEDKQISNIKPIFFKLLDNLQHTAQNISANSIINFFVQYLPFISEKKVKTGLLKRMMDILSKKRQLIQSALRILILAVPYLKDEGVKLTIIESLIPFLSNKNKRTRLRAYECLKQAVDTKYHRQNAIFTVTATIQHLEKLLNKNEFKNQSDVALDKKSKLDAILEQKGKLNAILIIKEILPILSYYNNKIVLKRIMSTIIPMIQDKNIEIAKNAIYFVGIAIQTVKKQQEQYLKITFPNVNKIIYNPQSNTQIIFKSLQYMKKAIPILKKVDLLELSFQAITFLRNSQFQKQSEELNEQQFTQDTKLVSNMAYIYLNVAITYINDDMLGIFFNYITNQLINQQNRKFYPNALKAIGDRANYLNIHQLYEIFKIAKIIITTSKSNFQTYKSKAIALLENIIDLNNPQHANLAKEIVQMILPQLRVGQRKVISSSVSLISKLYVFLQKNQLKKIIQLMVNLLPRENSQVNTLVAKFIGTTGASLEEYEKLQIMKLLLPLIQYKSLKVKTSAFQCIVSILSFLSEMPQYQKIVGDIVMVIFDFIKGKRIAFKDSSLPITKQQIHNRNEQLSQNRNLHRAMVSVIESIFPKATDRQRQYYLFKYTVFPAINYQDYEFNQISKQFIINKIIQQKITAQFVIVLILGYLQDNEPDNQNFIQFIGWLFQQVERYIQVRLIKKMIMLFSKFNEKTRQKIHQLIMKSLIYIEAAELLKIIIGQEQQEQYSYYLNFGQIYYLSIVIKNATKEKADMILSKVISQSDDQDINIRKYVRNIIENALPKINEMDRDYLVQRASKDITSRQQKQKIQTLMFLMNCSPYTRQKMNQSYIKIFRSLLNDNSLLVRGTAIKFMSKLIQQLMNKTKRDAKAINLIRARILPLLNTQKLDFENSINFVQMIHAYLDKASEQILLKKIQPFFNIKDDEQFLKKIKSVKEILSQLDHSIKMTIVQNAFSFIANKSQISKREISILHTVSQLFPLIPIQAYQTVKKLIPFLRHEDKQIRKQVKQIIRMEIYHQKDNKMNKALLILNVMIVQCQSRDEPRNIEYTSTGFQMKVSNLVDKLIKKASLSFDLNILHEQNHLMDAISVALKDKGAENNITLFGKTLQIDGVMKRQSLQISRLLSKYSLLNTIICEKIKNYPKIFAGKNFTILIDISKANNYIYGVILQNYTQILEITQTKINEDTKQGKTSQTLQYLQKKIMDKQIDRQSFFTQQLLKRIVMMRLSDKKLSKQDSKLLSICIQCDLTISFNYQYDENDKHFENMYRTNYSIDLEDFHFQIKSGSQNLFAILRDLFRTEQGLKYALHKNIFTNNQKNIFRKAAIDTGSFKDIFLFHKKIIKKFFENEKRQVQQQFLQIDWNKINLIHLIPEQASEDEAIYLIMKRDEFGNITARKFFQNRKGQEIIEHSQHDSQCASDQAQQSIKDEQQINQALVQDQKNDVDDKQQEINAVIVQDQKNNTSKMQSMDQGTNKNKKNQKNQKNMKKVFKKRYLKKPKQYKDYILHLKQYKQYIKAFRNQLIGQKESKRKKYSLQCIKMSLDDYESSYGWSLKSMQQYLRKKKQQTSSKAFSGKFPKWVLLGQAMKPYQLIAQDIQNIEQILQITGIAAKSKLKKAMKKFGKNEKEKEMISEYAKIAYWKLTNMVQSYGLVDCGILKKDDDYRAREDQFSKQDTFIQAADFFGDMIESIPTFGTLAKSCVDFLSEKAKANIDRKQRNSMTAFLQLFQESCASVDERNLLIDQVILQLVKKRMKVLLSEQKEDKVPFLFNVINVVKQLKDKIDNVLLEQELSTTLSGKRSSIMAKMDIATLAMAIMSKQTEIVKQAPERSQIPSMLMGYLEQKIIQDEQQQTTGFMARVKRCLFVYENCCRANQNEDYEYGDKSIWQKVKIYLGACFCCCKDRPAQVSDDIEHNILEQSEQQIKHQGNKVSNKKKGKLDQSYPSITIMNKSVE